jgi:hypothetical protein
MKPNVGSTECFLRIATGILLSGVFLFAGGKSRWPGFMSMMPILTGVFAWRPAVVPFEASPCGTVSKSG